jgi:hypothetical protein
MTILPSTAGADVVSAITGALTDNIAPVLVVFGAIVGIRWVFRLFNHGAKGKVRA